MRLTITFLLVGMAQGSKRYLWEGYEVISEQAGVTMSRATIGTLTKDSWLTWFAPWLRRSEGAPAFPPSSPC